MMNKGFFITFEGTCDGLGKTTQAQLLKENLEKMGYQVVLTREPAGTEFGQYIRDAIQFGDMNVSDRAELGAFITDRAEHYEKVLKPSLENGKIVVCDRYYDSTFAYQGSKGWDELLLKTLHDFATEGLTPNMTIVLDGKPFKELDMNDNFEKRGAEYYKQVRTRMLKRIGTSDRYVSINANRDMEKNAREILNAVLERLNKQVS